MLRLSLQKLYIQIPSLLNVFSFLQLEVPKELISPTQLQELRMQWRPSFIPISPEINDTKVQDKDTGITQRRLSNGIPVNYKVYLAFVSYGFFLIN